VITKGIHNFSYSKMGFCQLKKIVVFREVDAGCRMLDIGCWLIENGKLRKDGILEI